MNWMIADLASFSEMRKQKIQMRFLASLAAFFAFAPASAQLVTYQASGIIASESTNYYFGSYTPSPLPAGIYILAGNVGQSTTFDFTVDLGTMTIVNSDVLGPYQPTTFACAVVPCGNSTTGITASLVGSPGNHAGITGGIWGGFDLSVPLNSLGTLDVYINEIVVPDTPSNSYQINSVTNVTGVSLTILSSPTPEPNSILLSAAGFTLVGFVIWRRKTSAA